MERGSPAQRLANLTFAFTLAAFVVVGSPALAAAAPRDSGSTRTPSVSLGPSHGVDGTLADAGETRTSRADRHAPRQPDFTFLIPLALLASSLLLLGHLVRSPRCRAAHLRLCDSIGRRAPPAFATD